MPATVNDELCTGCEACVSECPSEVITVTDAKARVGEGCSDCGACATACPSEAIAVA